MKYFLAWWGVLPWRIILWVLKRMQKDFGLPIFPPLAPPVPLCQNLGMQFIPRGDRVVLEVLEEPKVTAGGIYVPDSVEDKPSRGIIVHAGEVASLVAGDKVLFSNYSGNVISDGTRDLLIITQRDIWAKIEENGNELE